MKHAELVKWLKTLLLIVGAIGLVFFLWVFPVFGKEIARMDPARAYLYWPCLIFVWFSGVLLYTAFWFLWQICGEIAKDHSFCEKNAVNLGRISKIALVESVLCTVGTVVLFFVYGGVTAFSKKKTKVPTVHKKRCTKAILVIGPRFCGFF